MNNYKLGEIEMSFADIIWENQPLGSGEVVKLANQKLDWKKSTTYTIIRKLCEKGLLQNKNGVVTALLTKDEYISNQSGEYIDQTFNGSLPNFLVAFSKGRKISNKDKEEILKIINESGE